MTGDGAGAHAIVIGGSIAGLLAAQALARRFASVTILERDALPDTTVARKGVPQGRHAHVLLQGGQDAVEALLAGTGFDLAAAGALRTDATRDVRWFQAGVWKQRFESGILAHWCDRPRLEHQLRVRIAALPKVHQVAEHRVTGLVTARTPGAGAGAEVVGVRALTRKGEEIELAGDLVVDASGGGSRTANWLVELGYPEVREDLIGVDVGYASRIYRRRHELDDGTVLAIYPKPPGSRRAGVLYPLDEDRWLVTLIGWVGDHPPADDAGFLEFARSLPVADLAARLDGAQALSPIRRHGFPASRWRRFERLARWPERLVVVGDAVCRFNPVYGQGMTVSALDALALERSLERPDGVRAPGGAGRLQAEFAGHRTTPWLLAASSDLRFPEATGRRPFWLGLLNGYTAGVLALAGEAPGVHLRFIKVIGFRAPPVALFHPAVALRVLGWTLARRSSGPKRAA